MIIGLTGAAGSGKDEVAKILKYERLAFADAIKDMAEELDPFFENAGMTLGGLLAYSSWDHVKRNYEESRAFLQSLGVAARKWAPNIWVDAVLDQVWPGGNYVITDVRFPNEVEAIVKAGGTVYRVVRPGAGLTGVNGLHASETALAGYDFPTIDNTGTLEDLEHAVTARFYPPEPPC